MSGTPTSPMENGGGSGNNPFQRIPSESSLSRSGNKQEPVRNTNKSWERSQSAINLENKAKDMVYVKQTSNEFSDSEGTSSGARGSSGGGSQVSEQSTVYWDLSKVTEDSLQQAQSASGGSKFKISLQTIHQKQEMSGGRASPSSAPNVSIQARVTRRMSTESVGSSSSGYEREYTLPAPCSPPKLSPTNAPTSNHSHTTSTFTFTSSGNGGVMRQSSVIGAGGENVRTMVVTLETAVPVLKESIVHLSTPRASVPEKTQALEEMLALIESAWATPTVGRDLAYQLCDVLRAEGGLEVLIKNCDDDNHAIQLGSARVLEQSMTTSNRDTVARKGLGVVVRMAQRAPEDLELTKVTTGILESLFKHSEDTCSKAIKLGGLDSILYSCRTNDLPTLRHCAVALANLAIYGGTDNQSEMIERKAPEWLFPLAFSQDDSIRYYAFLAIASLSANKELAQSVAQSGTLQLIAPFINSHDPVEFAHSDLSHIHGQSEEWLKRLVPLLGSKCDEAQAIAAFHFAMEAGIKAEQSKTEIFYEIEAIEPLKKLASSTNKLASKLAAQALRIIGEEIPRQLSPQVPLWSVEDVLHWLQQSGFSSLAEKFRDCQVDGDLLLQLEDVNLREDLQLNNGIERKRFLRELTRLKLAADYQSVDATKLDEWIREFDPELRQYVYDMVRNGADRKILRWLNEEHLLNDCRIHNGIHRLKLLEAAKRFPANMAATCGSPLYPFDVTNPTEKILDCFISYRRSNGSQLASLLKVHLQLRGFSTFLDIEKLRAGKFDDNLLNSVRNARNFILVLTPSALDRCVGDRDQKDWIHREIVAAIEGGCNIIPVLDNFQFPPPESFPEDMRNVCYFNGISWQHEYQDACIDRLISFILPQTRHSLPHSSSYASPLNPSQPQALCESAEVADRLRRGTSFDSVDAAGEDGEDTRQQKIHAANNEDDDVFDRQLESSNEHTNNDENEDGSRGVRFEGISTTNNNRRPDELKVTMSSPIVNSDQYDSAFHRQMSASCEDLDDADEEERLRRQRAKFRIGSMSDDVYM